MHARELMTEQPQAVTPSDPVQRAAEIMRDLDVGLLPIVSDRESMTLEGVITDRDITIRHVAEGHSRECTVNHHMTGNHIETVRPDADVSEVLEVMKRSQVRRVPVVEDGRLVGIIAQADVAMKESAEHPKEVADTIERISEPGHPRR